MPRCILQINSQMTQTKLLKFKCTGIPTKVGPDHVGGPNAKTDENDTVNLSKEMRQLREGVALALKCTLSSVQAAEGYPRPPRPPHHHGKAATMPETRTTINVFEYLI